MHHQNKGPRPVRHILLSYVGSGNHRVRFFIELFTELPTKGWDLVEEDEPIYKAEFSENIPFFIDNFENYSFEKEHFAPDVNDSSVQSLILIVRNPNEVLIRQVGVNLESLKNGILTDMSLFQGQTDNYFQLIEYYVQFQGPKLLLYFEDMIKYKKNFLHTLYKFLETSTSYLFNQNNKRYKLYYALSKKDVLFRLAREGKYKTWLGPKSNLHKNYYQHQLSKESKESFDWMFQRHLWMKDANVRKVLERYF
jgi:hypothetical protein